MSSMLDRLREERDSLVEFTETLVDKAAAEERDLVDTELKSIKDAETRLSEIKVQAEGLISIEEARAAASIVDKRSSRPAPAPRHQEMVEHRTLGQMWTESEEFRSYTGSGTSARFTIDDFVPLEDRAVGPDPLLLKTDPYGKLAPSASVFYGPMRQVRYPLLDLVGRINVQGESVRWLSTTEASGADVVPEGNKKPPITWTVNEVPIQLETVAGWFKYSRQALRVIPALRSLVDQKLRQAIDKKLNELATTALTGAKVAGNTTTGAQGVDLVAVVREAIAKLEATGISRNSMAVLLNPADAAAFDVLMLGKPLGAATVNGGMWGVPIVAVPGLTAGTAIVGDISEALVWFYNTGLQIYTTDSDVADAAVDGTVSDFRRNILTTLAEVYGKFAAVDGSAVQFAVFTPKP